MWGSVWRKGGAAHMANTKRKLRWLKLNLYSPGSGLTKLKVRESNSTGWYVMSRQSPLGSLGTCLYTLPTRAHSMFPGNNNTSYRLTAYLCKNSVSGEGIQERCLVVLWNHFLQICATRCCCFLLSLRRRWKILLRGVFGLSQSDASSSGCARRGVFRIFFFSVFP